MVLRACRLLLQLLLLQLASAEKTASHRRDARQAGVPYQQQPAQQYQYYQSPNAAYSMLAAQSYQQQTYYYNYDRAALYAPPPQMILPQYQQQLPAWAWQQQRQVQQPPPAPVPPPPPPPAPPPSRNRYPQHRRPPPKQLPVASQPGGDAIVPVYQNTSASHPQFVSLPPPPPSQPPPPSSVSYPLQEVPAPSPPDRFTPYAEDIYTGALERAWAEHTGAVGTAAQTQPVRLAPRDIAPPLLDEAPPPLDSSRIEKERDGRQRSQSPTPITASAAPPKKKHKKKRLNRPSTIVSEASVKQHPSPALLAFQPPPSSQTPSPPRVPSFSSDPRLQQTMEEPRPPPSQVAPPPPPSQQFSQVAQPVSQLHSLSRPATPSTQVPTRISPNAVFLGCCKARGVAPTCESRCNFDVLTKKLLTGMFLGTDPCPQRFGRDLLACAAQDSDHSNCCRERRVHLTAARDKCLGFCVMTPGTSFQADISMLPCWAVLNDIKSCFKDAILARG